MLSFEVSEAKAEKKHKQAKMMITQLKMEKSDLTNEVKTLKDRVEVLENQLSGTHLLSDKLLEVSEKSPTFNSYFRNNISTLICY